jgi:hypothetical protein
MKDLTIAGNDLIEVLDDRTAKLNFTFFQQITTFFQFDLGSFLPF